MKKILVFASLNEGGREAIIKGLKDFPVADSDVEWIYAHIFKETAYPYIIPPYFYPIESDKPEFSNAIKELLIEIGTAVGHKPDVLCRFATNIKTGALEVVEQVKPDLIVTVASGLHGVEKVFASSFTENILRHSPIPLLALK